MALISFIDESAMSFRKFESFRLHLQDEIGVSKKG